MDKGQRRLELSELLVSIVKPYVNSGDRTKHVYYNPPTGMQLEYPCIIYEEGRPANFHADNKKYFSFQHWKITTITRDPEGLDLAPKVQELPHCSLDSAPYKTDGLLHHVFGLYW